MRVSRIDINNDWMFGRGRANYLRASKAIGQNVKTRLRSFEQDWVHDTSAGISWVNLLGNLGTERRILRAVERTVLQTDGVISVGRLEIVRRDANRDITIEFDYTDVFGEAIADRLEFVV